MLYFQVDWHIQLEKWFGFYKLGADWIVYKGLFYTRMEAGLSESLQWIVENYSSLLPLTSSFMLVTQILIK